MRLQFFDTEPTLAFFQIWKGATTPIVETEYREMLFRVETEHSDKELYRIIAQ